MKSILKIVFVMFSIVAMFATPVEVMADGTETLGDPSISIASGTGIIAAGTGMRVTQPATITLDVPTGAIVKQVLLYWEGQMSTDEPGDDTIMINGTEVEGDLIGGQAFFFSGAYSSSFRADITSLGLVSDGSNLLTLDDLNFSRASNGAGVLVIFDDGSNITDIQVRDGLDLAFINFPEPRKSTVPQTFNFSPVDFDRNAEISMFFASVQGQLSYQDTRPTTIEITTGGTTVFYRNLLDSSDGDEWDTVNLDILVPAGASSLTVQAFSRDDEGTGNLPASFSWLAAGLSVPPGDRVACRVTAGGNKKDSFCDVDLDNCAVDGSDTWGGQFGAPPRIDGNWTHHHALSDEDSFVFHSNEMFNVICSDPGPYCKPARFAPNRQIDFMGLGRFNNKQGVFSLFPDGSVCFQVHLEDTGEGGPGSRKKAVTEECTHCPGTPIVNGDDCPNCTDYYMIEIYNSAANNGTNCTGSIIYTNGPGAPDNCTGPTDPQLNGYFTDRGNVQLHPDKNGP